MNHPHITELTDDNMPIGIFDSGIGGLAVARAVKDLLPGERIMYFGDTAHMPYGAQSSANLLNYTRQICDFFLDNNCKVILIACNTAASVAQEMLRSHIGNAAILLDVISPMVDHIAVQFPGQLLGLIGTELTVSAGEYAHRLLSLNSDVHLRMLATPELIAMIEEGQVDSSQFDGVLCQALESAALCGIQGLILGCTHYAYIKSQIVDFYKNRIPVLDSSTITAQRVQYVLARHDLLRKDSFGEDCFYVSKWTSHFESVVRTLFDQSVYQKELMVSTVSA